MTQLVETLRKKAVELHEERASLYKKMVELQARIGIVNGAIAGIDALLRVDGVASADHVQTKPSTTVNVTVNPSTGEVITGEPPPLYDVVHSALQDGKPHTTQEVLEIAQARGVRLGVHPLRNVAGTLVGLARGAKVKRLDDGRFQKVAD